MAEKPELKKKGDAAFKKKEYSQAIELYTQLLEGDPSHVVALLNIGACYIEKRDWEKAREVFAAAQPPTPPAFLVQTVSQTGTLTEPFSPPIPKLSRVFN